MQQQTVIGSSLHLSKAVKKKRMPADLSCLSIRRRLPGRVVLEWLCAVCDVTVSARH